MPITEIAHEPKIFQTILHLLHDKTKNKEAIGKLLKEFDAKTINQIASDGKTTPLLFLFYNNVPHNENSLHILQFLLSRGADTEAVCEKGMTALHHALFSLRAREFHLLIKYGANILASVDQGSIKQSVLESIFLHDFSHILFSSEVDYKQFLQQIFSKAVNCVDNKKSPKDNNLREKLISEKIAQFVPIIANILNTSDNTGLIVDALCESGFRLNLTMKSGNLFFYDKPLGFMAKIYFDRVYNFFEFCKNPSSRSNLKLDEFLDRATFLQCDIDGNTPLHLACQTYNVNIVDYFNNILSRDKNNAFKRCLTIRNKEGQTPLDIIAKAASDSNLYLNAPSVVKAKEVFVMFKEDVPAPHQKRRKVSEENKQAKSSKMDESTDDVPRLLTPIEKKKVIKIIDLIMNVIQPEMDDFIFRLLQLQPITNIVLSLAQLEFEFYTSFKNSLSPRDIQREYVRAPYAFEAGRKYIQAGLDKAINSPAIQSAAVRVMLETLRAVTHQKEFTKKLPPQLQFVTDMYDNLFEEYDFHKKQLKTLELIQKETEHLNLHSVFKFIACIWKQNQHTAIALPKELRMWAQKQMQYHNKDLAVLPLFRDRTGKIAKSSESLSHSLSLGSGSGAGSGSGSSSDLKGDKEIFDIIKSGKLEKLRNRINIQNVNAISHDKMTPILYLLSLPDKKLGEDYFLAAIRILLTAGANIEVYNNDGLTPLHQAILTKMYLAEPLIEFGANIRAVVKSGKHRNMNAIDLLFEMPPGDFFTRRQKKQKQCLSLLELIFKQLNRQDYIDSKTEKPTKVVKFFVNYLKRTDSSPPNREILECLGPLIIEYIPLRLTYNGSRYIINFYGQPLHTSVQGPSHLLAAYNMLQAAKNDALLLGNKLSLWSPSMTWYPFINREEPSFFTKMQDEHGNSIWHLACQYDHADFLKEFLCKFPDSLISNLHKRNASGETILDLACSRASEKGLNDKTILHMCLNVIQPHIDLLVFNIMIQFGVRGEKLIRDTLTSMFNPFPTLSNEQFRAAFYNENGRQILKACFNKAFQSKQILKSAFRVLEQRLQLRSSVLAYSDLIFGPHSIASMASMAFELAAKSAYLTIQKDFYKHMQYKRECFKSLHPIVNVLNWIWGNRLVLYISAENINQIKSYLATIHYEGVKGLVALASDPSRVYDISDSHLQMEAQQLRFPENEFAEPIYFQKGAGFTPSFSSGKHGYAAPPQQQNHQQLSLDFMPMFSLRSNGAGASGSHSQNNLPATRP